MNKVSPSVDTVRPVEAVTAVTAAKPLKQKTVFEHESEVTTCSFSEGLLAVGAGKKMTVYNLKTGTKEHVFEHEESVNTCSFSHEGLFAVGDFANKMTVYNLKTGTKEHVFELECGVLE
jgi:WD40 repeat protein